MKKVVSLFVGGRVEWFVYINCTPRTGKHY